MGQPAARQGDQTAHGGTITVGCMTVLIGGQPAARIGDLHTCPMQTPGTPPIPHVGGPITGPGVATVLIGGMPAAVVGDMCVCTGPPDSIVAGEMTVLIGAGGGGGGGAAGSASATEGDADVGEGTEIGEALHMVANFTDRAGNPVVGPRFELTNPDGNSESGTLSGTIDRTTTTDGDYEIDLRDIVSARWSMMTAQRDDDIQLQIQTMGIEDGTAVRIEVYVRDIRVPDRVVETISDRSISGDSLDVAWHPQWPEEGDDSGTEDTEYPTYSDPLYYFAVTIGDLNARSGLLRFRDTIEIDLSDDNGDPLADTPIVIRLSNGEIRRATTDNNGHHQEEMCPVGGWSVEVDSPATLDEDDSDTQTSGSD